MRENLESIHRFASSGNFYAEELTRKRAVVATVVTALALIIGIAASTETASAASLKLESIDVSSNGAFVCGVTTDHGAMCWGYNGFGQLGFGDRVTTRTRPTDVVGLSSGVKELAVGERAACALLTSGGVKCWGNNAHGELGRGSTSAPSAVPAFVSGLASGVKSITVGSSTASFCALMNDGIVKCWGSSVVPNGGSSTSSTPVAIAGLPTDSVEIERACVLSSAGSVKCWSPSTPIFDVAGWTGGVLTIHGGNGYCAIMTSHALSCLTMGNATELLPAGASAMSTGEGAVSCVLLESLETKCWGDTNTGAGGNGQLNFSSTTPQPTVFGLSTAVAAGSGTTCVLGVSGRTQCVGQNQYGEVGIGSTQNQYLTIPADVESLSPNAVPPTLSVLTTGQSHACAVTADGDPLCWGWNFSGQLGDGSKTSRTRPTDVSHAPNSGSSVGFDAATKISAGGFHSCAIGGQTVNGGELWCWGSGSNGQNGASSDRTSPVRVTAVAGVSAVAAGGFHTCAVLSTGAVKCFGSNNVGQLGSGSTTSSSAPVDVVGLSSGVVDVVAGYSHSCALTSAGAVKCWGAGSTGALGNGTLTDSTTPVPVVGMSSGVIAISAGAIGEHTCALKSNGSVWCWGGNAEGEIGQGDTANQSIPTQSVGLFAGATSVSAGGAHTCAAHQSLQLVCWGSNSSGQLADGGSNDYPHPTPALTVVTAVQRVQAGGNFTCAIAVSQRIQCWGANESGQLGDRSNIGKLLPSDVARLTN